MAIVISGQHKSKAAMTKYSSSFPFREMWPNLINILANSIPITVYSETNRTI